MNLFSPLPIQKVDKPWGHELIFAKTASYVGKILHVKQGHTLSLQYHREKEETLYLVRGEILLTLRMNGEEQIKVMKPGEAYHIPPGLIHRMEAVTDSDIAEVSTTQLDDVVRLEDKYGREGTSAP